MKKVKMSFAILAMILFSIFLVSCSGSPESVLEKAAEKNKEIKYVKQDVNATIEMAGVKMGVKAVAEVDNTNKKAIMDIKIDASAMGASNQNMDMYVDDKTMYVKDPTSDKYIKTSLTEGMSMNTGIASPALDLLKNDTKVKETVKMENGDNSDKVVSAEVSSETVKKILDNFMKSQGSLGSMNSEMGSVTEAMKNIDIENVKYTGKVNKDGFLYAEDLSFDMKEKQSGLTLKMDLKTKSTNINEDKKVTLPEIPKDKIVKQ